MKVRWTRHTGHCWRSKDELISDVLLYTLTHGCASVGQPARTDLDALCEYTGCSFEDLPRGMDDRDKWRERESGKSVLISGTWELLKISFLKENNSMIREFFFQV